MLNKFFSSIGNRGVNEYADRADCPYPAIRWAEPGPHIDAILQKEKGDWKNLTIEEKKALYRHSYRQTFAEFEAPRGDWKVVVGGVAFGIGLLFWYHAFMRAYVLPPLPSSVSDEAKQAQLKRMIDMRANPIEGIASKWDYEKNCWK